MIEINNCENCHHFNTLIDWKEGVFYQCKKNHDLWRKCFDYDPIERFEND